MLTKLDDYPIHQHAEPIAIVATSDRYAYDRYWYNGHDKEGTYFFAVAFGRYANLGITDASLSFVIDGQQHAFHASRRAPNDPTDLSIGPFELQILEPMGRHRIVIGPNSTGIECDLEFMPRTGVVKEKRQTLRNERHVVMDTCRMDQFGRWRGWIRYHGDLLLLPGDETLGMKDRSWGIRPVGERYQGGAPIDRFVATHFFWVPIHWENECTIAGWYEDSDGYQWHNDQVFLPTYANTESIPEINDPNMVIWQGEIQHQFKLKPGTRRLQHAQISMTNRFRDQLEIEIGTPSIVFGMNGLGYQHPKWAHGQWHRELVVEAEQWSVEDCDPLALENVHVQQVVTARRGDEVGYGVVEQMNIGPYSPWGLTDWFDGAT
jgi:hypothetical protein